MREDHMQMERRSDILLHTEITTQLTQEQQESLCGELCTHAHTHTHTHAHLVSHSHTHTLTYAHTQSHRLTLPLYKTSVLHIYCVNTNKDPQIASIPSHPHTPKHQPGRTHTHTHPHSKALT